MSSLITFVFYLYGKAFCNKVKLDVFHVLSEISSHL